MKFFPYGKNGHTIAIIGQYQSFLFSMSNESRPSASPQGEATLERVAIPSTFPIVRSAFPQGKATLKGWRVGIDKIRTSKNLPIQGGFFRAKPMWNYRCFAQAELGQSNDLVV